MLSPRIIDELRGSGAEVRIGFPLWLRAFAARGVIAITLGRRIYLSPVLLHHDGRTEAILRHELAHVKQIRELGLGRFLVRYVYEYARLRRRGLGAMEAYAANPFEREAIRAEEIERA